MAKIIHLRCHHCGEQLENRDETYCPPCNLYLAYRAMPLLLGMLLLGRPAVAEGRTPHGSFSADGDGYAGDEGSTPDLAAMNWE